MKAYFFSDLHLTNEHTAHAQNFLQFLKDLPEDTTHIFLLGNIFDLWMGGKDYFAKGFPQIINQIKALKEKNMQIYYFEGNHDLHLKQFWEDHLNIPVYTGAEYFTLGSYTVRAEHGDLMNAKDKGYIFLRKFLRSLPMKFLMENVPGAVTNKIGTVSSQMSRSHTQQVRADIKDQIIEMTRAHAQVAFKKEPFDFIFTGHTHIYDDFEFEEGGRMVRSINLGSWFDAPKVLELANEGLRCIDIL